MAGRQSESGAPGGQGAQPSIAPPFQGVPGASDPTGAWRQSSAVGFIPEGGPEPVPLAAAAAQVLIFDLRRPPGSAPTAALDHPAPAERLVYSPNGSCAAQCSRPVTRP